MSQIANIGRAAVSDATEILALQKLAYQSEAAIYNDYSMPPLVQTQKEMESDFRRQVVLKATIDGKLVGSVRAFVQEGTCHIGRLIVHPDFQRSGIGTRLMYEIERVASKCKRYELFTGERSENNIRFYQKMGYKVFKTEKLGDRVTLVYMEKTSRAT